jgi:hypothetical protein
MMQTALDEADLLESGDDFESDAFEDDAFSGDSLDEGDALDELDAAGDLADEFEAELDADDSGDGLDEFGDFALDSASGLYMPTAPRLISGPAAVAIAQRLNSFVVESMDADDADAFFRRIGRGLRRIGRVAGRVARVAAPVLRRVLPMVQRVAGLAGPWGRLVSAGIGAARGLASGRGLRGALAGAVGGLVPGVGGRLAGAVLGDGADDDAALDALADMSDAGEVTPEVALPLGAGLATRIATPRVAGNIPPEIATPAAEAEQTMLQAATAAGGSPGRRLRLLRLIARLIRAHLRRTGTARAAAEAFPTTARSVAGRVLRHARRRPGMYASSRGVALRRLNARRRILRSVPLAAAYPRPRMAAAGRRIR